MTLLEKGFKAFQQKDFHTAAGIWTKALHQSPTDQDKAKLHLNLGIVYSHLGDASNAILHYRQAITFSEQLNNLCVLGRAYMGLGSMYRKLDQLSDAIRYMERSIEIFEKLNDPLSTDKARANCDLLNMEAKQKRL